MPKSVQDKAKQLIHEMYLAPTRKAALAAYDQFISSYQSRLNSNKGTKCDIGFYLSKAIPSWVLVGKCVPPTERRLEIRTCAGSSDDYTGLRLKVEGGLWANLIFTSPSRQFFLGLTSYSSKHGLAQQRYVKSHRNLLRSPHSGPHPGTPYRPIRVTGIGRPLDSFCFRGLKSAESVHPIDPVW